jgi:chemotaxis signal transduction protein
MVRFRAAGTGYAVAVRDVRGVRRAADVSAMPARREGVVGLLREHGAALPVLSTLGAGGGEVLVMEADGRGFGLLVDEVSAVVHMDEERLGPPPEGQDRALVRGVLDADDGLVLVIDAAALGSDALGERS